MPDGAGSGMGGGGTGNAGGMASPAYGPQPGGGGTVKMTAVPLKPIGPMFPNRKTIQDQPEGGRSGGLFSLMDLLKGIIGTPFRMLGMGGGGGGGGGGGQAGIDPTLPYMPGDPYSQMPAGTGDPAAVRRMREGS